MRAARAIFHERSRENCKSKLHKIRADSVHCCPWGLLELTRTRILRARKRKERKKKRPDGERETSWKVYVAREFSPGCESARDKNAWMMYPLFYDAVIARARAITRDCYWLSSYRGRMTSPASPEPAERSSGFDNKSRIPRER